MRRLLSANFPYFSVAIQQVLTHKLFLFQAVCAALLVLHMLTEWLYIGYVARRLRLILLGGAICFLLTDAFFLQPRLKAAHLTAHAVNAPADLRQKGSASFRTWQI